MKITVFGSGYVGLVTGACLAEVGHDVLCMDIDADKIELLRSGGIPIYEPGLDKVVANGIEQGNLNFSTDVSEAVAHGIVQFIAVGTPPDEDGSADLQYVLSVARSIAEHMDDYRLVVNKSTVPVGTADKVREAVLETLQQRGENFSFDVASNPEFLKEGAAVDDFMRPDRTIIGIDSDRADQLLTELYAPFNRNHDRLIRMDIHSAELTKYAANAMLATRISFMNELSNIADKVGADIEKVRIGIGSDTRIGYHFIYAGCGYGGSCFPKDVKALLHTANSLGLKAELLAAVESVNARQQSILFEKIYNYFDGKLAGKTVALWGLAFKPNTDDMREASSRVLIDALLSSGARVCAFDPVAMDEARRIYSNSEGLSFGNSPYDIVENADALAIVTEWKQFRSLDLERIAGLMRQPAIFDGRNLYDLDLVERAGIDYFSIGRPHRPGRSNKSA